MFKLAIIFILFFSYKSSASSLPHLSFVNLIINPEAYNSEEILLSGYFLKTDEGAYLCMSMEACYTRAKERLRVRGLSEKNITKANKCHIGLIGKFIAIDLGDQGHWPISGFLDVSDRYLTSYHEGYQVVNEECEIFKELKKYKYGK